MRVAILNLHGNNEDIHVRSLFQLLYDCDKKKEIQHKIFDVCKKLEIADLSYDAYIVTGGFGNPLTSGGSSWEKNFFGLLNTILQYNRRNTEQKKHVLLIGLAFQIYCRYFGLGKVTKRNSIALGVMPVHKTTEGKNDELIQSLSNSFYVIENREYQVVEPEKSKLALTNGYVACLEKERPLIKFERAVMAIRFNDTFFGVQFHTEMSTTTMSENIFQEENRWMMIEQIGQKKYDKMLSQLDEKKSDESYTTIIPKFLEIVKREKENASDLQIRVNDPTSK